MPDIFVSGNKDKKNLAVTDASVSGDLAKKTVSFPKSTPTPLRKAFSSYLLMPQDVRFETQVEGEIVLLLLRRHWITNIYWILTTVILILTPLLLYPLVSSLGLIPSDTPSSYISLLIIVWYLAAFSYVFVEFLLWYFTVSIVTEDRIIDIDFSNILHKKYSETRLNRIEDVTMKTGGSIKALFDFGDVIIQTAGEQVQFHFTSVPHPGMVVRLINDLLDKSEHNLQP